MSPGFFLPIVSWKIQFYLIFFFFWKLLIQNFIKSSNPRPSNYIIVSINVQRRSNNIKTTTPFLMTYFIDM